MDFQTEQSSKGQRGEVGLGEMSWRRGCGVEGTAAVSLALPSLPGWLIEQLIAAKGAQRPPTVLYRQDARCQEPARACCSRCWEDYRRDWSLFN